VFLSSVETGDSGVTGQLADKPTRGQSSRGLVNLRTSQLAEMYYLKFGIYNRLHYLYASREVNKDPS